MSYIVFRPERWFPGSSFDLSDFFGDLAPSWATLPDGWRLSVELPGVRRESVELTLDERSVRVSSGGRTVSHDLPKEADPSTLRASMSDGLLVVEVSAPARASPRRIDVVPR